MAGERRLYTLLNAMISKINSHPLSTVNDVTATASEVNRLSGISDNIVTLLNGKQNTLESGTNIKTVNGQSLLGSGNIPAGAETLTLLWQNSSPDSSFGAQYVTVQNLSNYDKFAIEIKHAADTRPTNIIPLDANKVFSATNSSGSTFCLFSTIETSGVYNSETRPVKMLDGDFVYWTDSEYTTGRAKVSNLKALKGGLKETAIVRFSMSSDGIDEFRPGVLVTSTTYYYSPPQIISHLCSYRLVQEGTGAIKLSTAKFSNRAVTIVPSQNCIYFNKSYLDGTEDNTTSIPYKIYGIS